MDRESHRSSTPSDRSAGHGHDSLPTPVKGAPSDPERPEPELPWAERRAERRRLRAVRRERRRRMTRGATDRKNQGKDRKKARKGK